MSLAGTAAAQAAWSGNGALATGRYDHTATLLDNGRVLVVGGMDSAPLAGVQLYDPATNAWSSAAPMNTPRHGQAAVLLKSGKVLVAGGYSPDPDPASEASGYTRTAEIYDPAANTWKSVASMSTARFQPTMTVLDDGRVLVAGGSGDIETADGTNAAVPLASAEVYDPANDTWTDVPPMSAPRALATATILPNGDVLVAGGYDNATGELKSAELYDPSSNGWSATGSLADGRDAATATALPNGDVLVAGGDGAGDGALASAELYRADSGTWKAAASMAGARQSAAATLLKDGTVLVAGGEDARHGNLLDTTERYDPGSDAWTNAGTMALARAQHTLTALKDGRALVVGGNLGGFAGGLNSVERFSAATTDLTGATFAGRLVGTTSDVASAVLTNSGTVPVDVGTVSIAGAHAKDFDIVSNSCGAATLAPGDTCKIDVRFTPAAAGPRSATLTVADNTAGGTTIATLSGTGLSPASATDGTTPAAAAPAGGSAAAGATGQAPTTGQTPAAGRTPAAAVAASQVRGTAARGSCTVKTAQGRSTVSCRMTSLARGTGALRARLMRGTTVLASARTTARSGQATLTLRPARSLGRGRYAVVVARPSGSVLLRYAIRVK